MLHIILLVLLAQIIALLSPGPDFALVVKNSLLINRRAGICTGLGITLGVCVHLSYCVYLLPQLVGQEQLLMTLVRCLGALYLSYLGIQSIRAGMALTRSGSMTTANQSPKAHSGSTLRFILSGLLCHALNPKAILFFLSVFTVMITPDLPKYVAELAALGIVLSTITWFCSLSVLITLPKYQQWFSGYRFEVLTHYLAGSVLLLFAAILLFLTF